MADATLKRLLGLIGEGPAPVRRAAVLVAAEIGSRETALIKALLSATEDEDPELRLAAIQALGRLRAEQALPRLLELVRRGGAELEAAAEAAGCLGSRGAKAIEKLMHELPTAQRSRVAAALAHGDTDAAAVVAAHALLDDDDAVVTAAAKSLAADVPKLPPGRRKALARYLIEKLSGKNARKLSAASEAAMLRVLAALHDPRSEAIFWSRIDPKRPLAVRASALQALGNLGPPRGEKHIATLVQCASDGDFQIAAPAMILLQKVPVTPKLAPTFLKLFDAPDVAIRRFAVEKLGALANPEIARALARQLDHGDRRLREAALAALQNTSVGRKALIDALLDAANAETAWSLARSWTGDLPGGSRERILEKACSYHEAEDRR
ncbi:MAG: HEAT repeat domain-containing protein, partial [Gemmatales bacterium]|nr:HEAT repeat domain-containing protein [Gemmatales bacterium]MDW8387417.1 HEAT repeat domain-containing protein [Gemmatales bacterium]